MLTLTKVTSVPTPSLNKGNVYYDTTKEAWCMVDEYGAQWFFGEQRCVLSADTSADTSAGVLGNVTGLSFALRVSKRYAFKFNVIWRTATLTTVGIKLGFTFPASPTIFAATVRIPGQGADGLTTNTFVGTLSSTVGDAVIGASAEAITTDYIADIEGVIVNGTTAGTLQLQWASETTGSGVTVRQGSWGKLWLT